VSNSLLCLPFLSPSNRRFSATGGSAVFLDSWGNRITRRGGISDSCGLWLLRRRQRGRLGDHGRHGSRWRRRRRHDRRDIRRSRRRCRHVVGNRRGRLRRRDDRGVVGAGGNRRRGRRRGRHRRRHDGRDRWRMTTLASSCGGGGGGASSAAAVRSASSRSSWPSVVASWSIPAAVSWPAGEP
jgi:hypothetical protein